MDYIFHRSRKLSLKLCTKLLRELQDHYTRLQKVLVIYEETSKKMQLLKSKLVEAVVLEHYDPNKDCELRTNASHQG